MRESGRDDVLRDPARGVRGGAVDLGGVLAAEGAAAVATHAAVRVDDDLAAGQAGVAHGAAHDEAAGGVDVDGRGPPGDADRVEHRADDVLDHVLADLRELYVGRVLRRDDDGRDLDGLVVLVAHGHLGLAVRAQVGQRPVLADLGQALGEPLGQVDGHRHEDVRLVGRIAKHHALVAGADLVDLVVVVRAGERAVDALRNVGGLAVDQIHDAAGLGVEAIFGARVADLRDRVAHDLLDVHVRLGADLAHHDDGARGRERLDGATHVVDVRRRTVGVHVALLLKLRLLREDGVHDGVRDLVAHLVRVSLGNGLRGEEVVLVCHVILLVPAPPGDLLRPRPSLAPGSSAHIYVPQAAVRLRRTARGKPSPG